MQDDKNYLLLRVDFNDEFPRIEFVRKRKRDRARYFGPYPSAGTLRDYVRFVSRAYRICTCTARKFKQRSRPCMRAQMGWCSAPCTDPESNRDYRDRVAAAVELLTRRRQEAARLVETSMYQASDELRFEDASRYRDLLRSLNQMWGRHGMTVAMPADADVFGVFQGPLGGALFVLHVRNSLVSGSRSFFNEALFAPTEPDLGSIVYQFYQDIPPPELIISQIDPTEAQGVASLLAESYGRSPSFEKPVRGEKRALLEMTATNAQEVYEAQSAKALSRRKLMDDLAVALSLPDTPEIIECIDISSFQGGDAVGSISVAVEGAPSKRDYRSFHIRGDTTNDQSMMEEVVRRRLAQIAGSSQSRLIFIDGGRAHLARVAPLLGAQQNRISMAAIAKSRPEQGLENDRIYLPGDRNPVALDHDSRILLFVSALRDEAHRFGVEFHRKKRSKRLLTSPLLSIPGVGKKRRLDLIRHFGSYKEIEKATLEQIMKVKGLPREVARSIYTFLHGVDPDATVGSPGVPTTR